MRGAIPPLPRYVFIAWCLLKYKDSFNRNNWMSWGSSVGITTGYGLDNGMIGIRFPTGAGSKAAVACS
jgi:hypothetical protein